MRQYSIFTVTDESYKYYTEVFFKSLNKINMDFTPKTIFYNKKFKGSDPKYNNTSMRINNNPLSLILI